MIALEIVEQGKLVPGDTSPGAIAHRIFELFNLPTPGPVSVLGEINEFTVLFCAQQGSKIAAIEGANRPRWRCWILSEDLPGDVGGDAGGRIVQVTGGQGLDRDAPARLGVLEVDRHCPASSGSLLAMGVCGSRRIGGFDPEPDPVPARGRP